ncbi:iron(III) transport system ATP-binding protein [Xaviernesmea oryzae]|uniref:Iron(III) transport system ATP-binding protein n=1 Tax=Xaviernesmea oryzae TaxID=464029 RepID=A0A1X7FQD4_9HYPH|nr:ABC transporter ATP-binding protein [Xaviernesmea oryzae]SMF56367.1 iron(III) transport system ATP-binding protein [Xaviernesmea oryzae]
MADVVVTDLSRHYGSFIALDEVSFDVKDGEFLTLLGPSGCGKSTTLASLAGLDRPTSGKISIGGRTVFDSESGIFIDAQYRDLGLMFQSYALWPHMTVYKNIDFALELRKIRGAEAKQRIHETLEMVDMGAFVSRYPGELSGGQQQRVALARTLAYRPQILLLDEPLSNLDAKLRERARLWLSDLQRRTGVTTVYVTHDQSEALALSDRIIVMERGAIAQIGSPEEVYERPATAFVADFVGASNLFEAILETDGLGSGKITLSSGQKLTVEGPINLPSGPVIVSVRPEKIELSAAPDKQNVLAYELEARSYLGARNLAVVKVGSQSFRVECDTIPGTPNGLLSIPETEIRVFPTAEAGGRRSH